MSTYYVLDENKCLYYKVEGGIIPSDAVFVDFEIGNSPNEFSRFHYPSKQWVEVVSKEKQLNIAFIFTRSKRDSLLLASDWTQLPDVPIATKSAWADYRQQLRDITTQADPFNITWPISP